MFETFTITLTFFHLVCILFKIVDFQKVCHLKVLYGQLFEINIPTCTVKLIDYRYNIILSIYFINQNIRNKYFVSKYELLFLKISLVKKIL